MSEQCCADFQDIYGAPNFDALKIAPDMECSSATAQVMMETKCSGKIECAGIVDLNEVVNVPVKKAKWLKKLVAPCNPDEVNW